MLYLQIKTNWAAVLKQFVDVVNNFDNGVVVSQSSLSSKIAKCLQVPSSIKCDHLLFVSVLHHCKLQLVVGCWSDKTSYFYDF